MKKFIKWCNKNSGFLHVVLVLVLVGVTTFYAICTSNMANIMKKEFDVSNTPYIGIISETHIRKDYKLQFVPKIVNAGNVSVQITSIETDIPDSKYLFNTIILLPNQERSLLMEINKPDINKDLSFVVKIWYHSLTQEGEKYCILYNYEVDGGIPEKIYLKASEYCE